MRIAPKPQPGQEMSLDQLLKTPGRLDLTPVTNERWQFWPINTSHGQVLIEISKQLVDGTFDELHAITGSWRLICTDELYGLMDYLKEGVTQDAISFLMDAFKSKNLYFGTQITYTPTGKIIVDHNDNGQNNTHTEAFPSFNEKSNSQMLFGTKPDKRFLEVYNHFTGALPHFTFVPDISPDYKSIYQLCMKGNAISLTQAKPSQIGYGILARTEVLKP